MTRVRLASAPLRMQRDADPAEATERRRPRRIWEVDVSALLLVVPLLLGRQGMEDVFANIGLDGPERGDDLLLDLIVRCQRPCGLAEEVERQLDRRTSRQRYFCLRCPVSVLADWWAAAGEEERPALLWCIASDSRFDLEAALRRTSPRALHTA